MTNKIPDPHDSAAKTSRRDAVQTTLKTAYTVSVRTTVYLGVIGISILLWWAIGRYLFSG